jgi:hypothetical protein
MTTLSQLTDYWLDVPTNIPGIKMVTVGRDEQALDNQTMPGVANYPHLRVDTPSVVLDNEDENPIADFTYQLFLFAAVSSDNPADENAMLSDMLVLLQQLYAQLWADADANLFDLLTGPKEGDAIRAWSGDQCYGWTLKIKIRLHTATC